MIPNPSVFTPEETAAFLSAVKGFSDYVPFRNNLTGTVITKSNNFVKYPSEVTNVALAWRYLLLCNH